MNQPKCQRCGSLNVTTRLRTRDVVCRRCGHVQAMEKQGK